MKLISFIPGIFILAFNARLEAQNALFLSSGKIEFERKVNLYSQMQDMDDSWKELFQKSTPKFKTTYFNLSFSDNKTIYQPGKENADNNKLWEQPAEENVIYSDLENSQVVSQKRVFEQLFLVKDSARNIKWKITDEIKPIAGFQCRRANAIIMDSIYVVAFYTEEILTPGGPESFSGLPGMILGVALPHQHITWFATKVQATQVKETEFVVPAKGKKINNASLKETMQNSLKEWGKWGRRYIEAALL